MVGLARQDFRIDAKARLNQGEREDLEHQIRIDLKQIRIKFTKLQTALRKSLTQREVKTTEIIAHIVGYGVIEDQIGGKDENLFKNSEERLRSTTSIDEAFIELSKLWSCIEYEILAIIVDEYGDNNDQKMMQGYGEALKLFFENKKLSEIPKDSKFTDGDRHTSGETHERAIIKLNLDDPLLIAVTNLKSKICEILGLKPSILVIEEIKEGCVEVILLVPKHLVNIIFGNHLNEASYKEQFLSASVIFISCKDFCINFTVSIVDKRSANCSIQGPYLCFNKYCRE